MRSVPAPTRVALPVLAIGEWAWGRQLTRDMLDRLELVGLADTNSMRLTQARRIIGTNAPAFCDVNEMLSETRPDTLIVATRDDTHAEYIVAALEAGIDVVCAKPMATTAEDCRRTLAAERRTGRRVDVGFNYRFGLTAAKIKELLLAGAIGEVVSIDFRWYLDTRHGADYFRRWHAFFAHSGSLFVHKASHHFDLLNWFLDSDPSEIFARGELVHNGKNGVFRGPRRKIYSHSAECEYHFDLGAEDDLKDLYEGPSTEDGYFRDGCVFRDEIDTFDTMSAALIYENGVQVSTP